MIEELAADISHHGLTDLQVFTFGTYYPLLASEDDLDHEPPRLGVLTNQFGGTQGFRRAVTNAHERYGVRTGIIVSQRLWNVAMLDNELRHLAESWVMRRSSGAPVVETWSHNHFGADAWGSFHGNELYVVCPAIHEWQDFAIENVRRLVELTGCSMLFVDQASEYWPCFNASHEHTSPSDSLKASSILLTRLREALRDASQGDVVLIGEGIELLSSQLVDLGWHWEFREKDGRLQIPNPEVFRYTLPWARFALPVADDIPTANRWFVLGLYLAVIPGGLESGKRLSDFPAFAEHLAKLAAFRVRLERLLVQGTFVDDVGIDVEGAYGKAYVTEAEVAVVVANLTSDTARCRVSIDRKFHAVGTGGTRHALGGDKAPVKLEASGTTHVELPGYGLEALVLPRRR